MEQMVENELKASDPVINFMNYAGVQGVWMIDPEYGLHQLNHFMALNSTLNSKGDLLNFFKESKQESLRINLIDVQTEQMESLESLEAVSDHAIGKSIVNIRLAGSMFLEDGLCHYGMNTFARSLRLLDSMNQVKGVIMSVNSGGGEALAAQKVYSAVSEFSKPIVAHVEMAGSAAYWGVIAADRVIGEGTISAAGSIGALFSLNKQMIKYIAENYDDIYSDLSPGKNKGFRDYLKGDTSELKRQINDLAGEFQAKVIQHRPIGYKAKETLEGGMFRGKDAKKRGLLDSIGGMTYAINQLKKLI